MRLVAVDALPDDAQQLVLQARHLRRDIFQLRQRHFADVGMGQRLRFAGMPAIAHRVEPHQLARQVKADHLRLAIAIHRHGLERAFARHEQRAQRLADAEQGFATLQRPPVEHDPVQLLHVLDTNARGQAQHLQGTIGAAAPQPGDVEDVVGVGHV